MRVKGTAAARETAVDVAIIGAGPAGLTAGYLLTKAGKIGGDHRERRGAMSAASAARWSTKATASISAGTASFPKAQQVVDLWNEILPDDFIQRPRMSRIYYEGKFYSYPLRAFEALWNLGIVRTTLCMASFCQGQDVPRHAGKKLRGLDHQPVRPQALFDLLQDLYREGLGHALRRNERRLGRAADQGPRRCGAR